MQRPTFWQLVNPRLFVSFAAATIVSILLFVLRGQTFPTTPSVSNPFEGFMTVVLTEIFVYVNSFVVQAVWQVLLVTKKRYPAWMSVCTQFAMLSFSLSLGTMLGKSMDPVPWSEIIQAGLFQEARIIGATILVVGVLLVLYGLFDHWWYRRGNYFKR